MNQTQKAIRVAAILTLAIILVGCNSSTPTVVVAPTQDIPSIRTESASTVIAQVTLEAASNPTATTAPTETQPAATETSAPTATSAATNTPVPTFTPAVSSGSSSTTSGTTGIIYPTRTSRSGPDLAVIQDQTPKDGAVYQPGQEFDASFTFKNIGTSTWTTEYIIRVTTSKGTNLSEKNFYPLHAGAAPGETVTTYADMKAPSTAGRYVTYWELCNANDDIFYTFYTVIDVK